MASGSSGSIQTCFSHLPPTLFRQSFWLLPNGGRLCPLSNLLLPGGFRALPPAFSGPRHKAPTGPTSHPAARNLQPHCSNQHSHLSLFLFLSPFVCFSFFFKRRWFHFNIMLLRLDGVAGVCTCRSQVEWFGICFAVFLDRPVASHSW